MNQINKSVAGLQATSLFPIFLFFMLFPIFCPKSIISVCFEIFMWHNANSFEKIKYFVEQQSNKK